MIHTRIYILPVHTCVNRKVSAYEPLAATRMCVAYFAAQMPYSMCCGFADLNSEWHFVGGMLGHGNPLHGTRSLVSIAGGPFAVIIHVLLEVVDN